MITLQLKNGWSYNTDEVLEKDGKYIFTYVRKDGTTEKHELDKSEVVDKFEVEDITVEEYWEKKNSKKAE